MAKSRSEQLYQKAEEERQRCIEWLLPFVRDNQPKFLTKAELHDAALRELKVSKNAFDAAWTEVIERTRRYDGIYLSAADCVCLVGWSTASRGHVRRSRTSPEETGSRPGPASKDRIIPLPNWVRNRVDHRTITGRSWDDFGTLEPSIRLYDCTFLDEVHRAIFEKKNA